MDIFHKILELSRSGVCLDVNSTEESIEAFFKSNKVEKFILYKVNHTEYVELCKYAKKHANKDYIFYKLLTWHKADILQLDERNTYLEGKLLDKKTKCIPLNIYHKQPISIVNINDEFNIIPTLLGSNKLIAKQKPTISLHINSIDLKDKVFNILLGYGYELKFTNNNYFIWC